jgi:hypothetical protein
MSLLLELNIPTPQTEETLDTLAGLPFAIDPEIRETPGGKRTIIEFSIESPKLAAQVENALLGRGLLQARIQLCDPVTA